MSFKIRSGLLPLNLLVVVLAGLIILSTADMLRIILGLPFVLLFPGYALMIVLFPSKARMTGIERAALSFGLSIAVVTLLGLILNYTPWGIRLESMLSSIVAFIFIMSYRAWLRQRGLPEQERFNINFQLKIPSWGTSARDKALSIIMVLSIIGALGMLGYVTTAPKIGEKFTEFYFLEQQSKVLKGASGYSYVDIIQTRAEVRDIFFEEKGGIVAVAFVTEGKGEAQSWALSPGIPVRVWRGEELVNESVVSSFWRFKGVTGTTAGAVSRGYLVRAVATAFALEMPSLADKLGEEYGFGIKGFSGFQVGNILEFFTPSDVRVGREERIIVGIVNHEYETVSYRLEARIDGVQNNEVEVIALKPGERWENPVSFTPVVAGRNQKVEFTLYKNGEVKPSLEPLRFWVDVRK